MYPERIWRNVLLIGAMLVLLPGLLGACQAPASETTMPATLTTGMPAPTTTAIPATTTMPATTTDSTPAPHGSPIKGNLLVFAAAAFTESFAEIGNNFELAHPGMRVSFNFAGGPQLNQQIQQGAPADVIALANIKHMDVTIGTGRVISETLKEFAQNRVVAIVSISSSMPITQLSQLATPGVKLVLGAKEITVGEVALHFLEKATRDPAFGPSYRDAVLANVVSYEQSVKAVLTKVVLGEGDAGIVFVTDITPNVADKIHTIPIPDHLNTITTSQIAVLKDNANPEAAQAFVDYVLSPEGKAIMKKYGFILLD